MRWVPSVFAVLLLPVSSVWVGCRSTGSGQSEDSEGATSASTSTSSTSASSSSDGMTSSTGGTTLAESSGGESSTGLPPDTNNESCEGAALRPKPNDASQRGPWPVGAATITVDGMAVEVFYPALPGSEAGLQPVVYDIRDALPEAEAAKIADEVNPPLACDCYADLPIDDSFGPYPVIVFVHGTAGFRTQSVRHLTHWASRGFVVLAADHPGLELGDLLALAPGCSEEPPPPQDLAGDLAALFAAVAGETGELAAFASIIDASRIGTTGHSAGGNAVGPTGGQAQVIVPLAARPSITGGSALRSSVWLGGLADAVIGFDTTTEAFDAAVSPKRLIGIEGAGHLAFSEICSIRNANGDSMLDVAQAADVCGAQFAGALFQCSDKLTPDPAGWEIIEFASASAFEEVLHCSPTAAANFDALQTRFDLVAEYRAE